MAERELSGSALTIEDAPHLSDSEIVARIETWSAQHRGGMAVVDHLDGRESEIGADTCSHALKSVAVRTRTAVLATSHSVEESLEGEAGVAPVSSVSHCLRESVVNY